MFRILSAASLTVRTLAPVRVQGGVLPSPRLPRPWFDAAFKNDKIVCKLNLLQPRTVSCQSNAGLHTKAMQYAWQRAQSVTQRSNASKHWLSWKRGVQSLATAATQQGGAPIAQGLSDSGRRQLVAWLTVCSGWVFSLVVLGGITRLTRSGLSMTDWKFTGEKPPLSEADWSEEFAKYQQSPEFKKVNSRMTVEEFKFIYWMEYSHRMWGRALGLVFVVPALYFASRGMIRGPLASRLAVLLLMGGAQGFVGWWMVRSGLEEPVSEHAVPRVSPYRLAMHLTSAFAIYSTLVWTTLSLAYPTSSSMTGTPAQRAGAALLRSRVLPLSALIAVTAVSGAFVAGLQAGHAFNTFPTMNGQWIPDEYFDVPGWRNAFENTAAVQLHHRILAVSTLCAVGATWLFARPLALPASTRLLMHGLLAVTGAQVALGITTLLMNVPVELGSAHQAGALTLFTVVLGLLHSLRPQAHLSKHLAMLLTPGVVAAVVGVGGMAAQMK